MVKTQSMIEIILKDGKKVDAIAKGQTIKTDQSKKSGGDGSAPEPFQLFLASIGTCAGVYVKNFCEQRNIPTDNIKIIQTNDFNTEKRLIENIQLSVELPDDFPEKYKNAVLKAANLCAVKRHLADPPKIETIIK
jgi:putative redox protein